MKNIRSLLALLLLIAMLLSAVACTPTGDPSQTSGSGESTTAPETLPSDEKILIFSDEKWQKPIIRAEFWSNNEFSISMKIVADLENLTNVRPKLGMDFKRKDEVYDSTTAEILFGYTAYPESREVYNSLSLGEAEIRIVGQKIVIAGYSYEALNKLYLHLMEVFKKNYKDGKIEVTAEEIQVKYNVDSFLSSIPLPKDVTFSSIESCGYDQSLYIFEDATPDTFTDYKNRMSSYTLESESVESGNYFATYTAGKNLVNISYSKHDECFRIIVNKNKTATPLFDKKEVKKVCEPMILMHGLGWEVGNQNGLCMLIRLSDGTFIVVDGGFNRDKDATDLYNLLVKHTPQGMKPTVSAWFITHAHGDHHATFANRFVAKYKLVVNIKAVIFNPPSAALNQTEKNEGGGAATVISAANSINGCEWIRCHVGDKYYVGDAEVDMLYTVDYQYPDAFTYYNTCSIIFSVKIAGQRIIITGDGANSSFSKVIGMFGADLKADILQVAHHGYGTGVSESASTAVLQAYKHISPSLVLWPIGEVDYPSVSGRVYNQVLFQLPSVKEIVVAKAADHLFDLPYVYVKK